jgi:hypothetical protein
MLCILGCRSSGLLRLHRQRCLRCLSLGLLGRSFKF